MVGTEILEGTPISLTEAAKLCPGRPHMATLWRWATSGCRGVKLITVVMGSRRYTSRESLERFLEATTEAAAGHPAPPALAMPKTSRRRREIAAAEARLAKAGI